MSNPALRSLTESFLAGSARPIHRSMAVAQSEIQSPGASKNPKLKAVPDVEIDKNGKFKYILIKVHDPDKEREFKHIVRGTAKAAYHGKLNLYFFSTSIFIALSLCVIYIYIFTDNINNSLFRFFKKLKDDYKNMIYI